METKTKVAVKGERGRTIIRIRTGRNTILLRRTAENNNNAHEEEEEEE